MDTQDHQPAEAPARRPRRSRSWIVMFSVMATIGLLCMAISYVPGSTSQQDIGTAADAAAIPAEFKLIHEKWSGNALCLDECLLLHRRYSSPLSTQETFQVLVSALQAAGFQCTINCVGFDSLGNSLSTTWNRSDRTIKLVVFTSDNHRGRGFAPFDATRQVHADVEAS